MLMKPHLTPLAATLMAAAVHSAPTDAIGPPSVTEIRPLMVAALQAPDGNAYGTLTGPWADAITQHFKATSPIHIDVTTVQRYAQPGCARLNVRLWQDGVQLPGKPPGTTEPRRQAIDFGLNYCLDGSAPRSLVPEHP